MYIKTPKHISIMMDGNRRWAKEKNLPSFMGHKAGEENLEKLVEEARNLGVECVSVWGFSTENWKRSQDEINYIFDLGRSLIAKFKEKCQKEKIRFVHLGRKDRFPQDIAQTIQELEEETKIFDGFTFALAVDYGGCDELVRTFQKIKNAGLEINCENIEANLDTKDLPQVDFIIRTGGELRLSGYMPWQSTYAELYFTKVYFPDFGPEQLKTAIEDFSNRDRRFGGDSTKI